MQKTFNCYGGFCKSLLINNQVILPQEKGSLEVIDTYNFESVNKFVPDTEDSQLGSVMCLETFEIKGTKYLLVGYESGMLNIS